MQQLPPNQPQYPPQGQWSVSPPDQGPVPYQWAPPPKKSRKKLWLIIGAVIAVLVIGGIAAGASGGSTSSTPDTTSQATQPAQATQALAKPTVRPTATPTTAPTQTQAQIEATYKASTKSTTVTSLDKDGSADQGEEVHFTGVILNFVKDSNGNTAWANVDDLSLSSTSVVQVAFPSNTDLSQLNQEDTLEVWGTDEGVFSETNAFGGTIQEVVITAQYMFDQTTNYQAAL